ncbi:MAG: hypothetical protein IJO16_05945 [Clostridia bacterium]|nr:hypothetical protein [Clostridia bacterium]MBQ6868191.1 hypothetical protein [Clostridia bacterium]MBQ6932832.1 hypothetical protein [Clostridia bacterium]
MTWIDEEAYQSMINALNNFVKQVTAQCDIIDKATEDCLDNTDDENVKPSAEALAGHIKNIKAQFPTVEDVIKKLEEQLEKAREARRKAEAAANQ